MNVLGLLQAAALEMGIPSPSAYNSDTKLLNLLYSVSRKLRNTRIFPQQKRTQTVTLVAGTYEYAVAADFYAGLLGTQFDQTNRWELVGPLSDSEWNYRLYGPGSANAGRNAYRVFGPTATQVTTSKILKFDPNTFVAATVSFDYITGSMFYTSGAALSTTLKEAAAADSDLPMFDDDLLISGLKAAYKKEVGLQEWQPDEDEFNRLLEAAETRFTGSYRGSFINRSGSGEMYFRNGVLTYSF